MSTSLKTWLVVLVCVLLSQVLTGCPPSVKNEKIVSGFENIPDSLTVVIKTETELSVFYLPDTDRKLSYPPDTVLTWWSDGLLLKNKDEVEWWDWDEELNEMSQDTGVDITRFETPIAVGPEDRIIYALGHTVPPLRAIEAHYLDGQEFDQIGSTTADEVDTLNPLPANNWPMFWLDRPDTAGTNLIEDTPTRKLRVYAGRAIGGELFDVIDYFPLENCVVFNREDEGWMLFELRNGTVSQRTMSLGEIPGDLTPAARDGNNILIISDNAGGSASSSIITYDLYRRTYRELIKGGTASYDEKIYDIAVVGPGDYYYVSGKVDSNEYLLFHYQEGPTSAVSEAIGTIKSDEPEFIDILVRQDTEEIQEAEQEPEQVSTNEPDLPVEVTD